jgi:hypothetical protein
MSEGYHPRIDDTPMCIEKYSAKYRSMIGCCIWIIVFRRFDIAHETSDMNRLNMSPREGHLLKAAKRILAYFKKFRKERIIVDTAYLNHSNYHIEDHPNWKDFYPDAEEEVSNDLNSKTPKVWMTAYVDAYHTHDILTRRFVTGILSILNNTQIRRVSKYQIAVETSTHVSELVPSRIATELILEVRFILRSLGVDLDGPKLMQVDNMSMVLNALVPSSVLKKNHNTITYHHLREAIKKIIFD